MRALIIDIGQKKDIRDILGQDILLYQLDWLRAAKITDITVFTDNITKNLQYDGIHYYACTEPPKYELLKTVLDDKPFFLLNGPVLTNYSGETLNKLYNKLQADVLCLTGGSFYGETFAVERDGAAALLNVFGSGETVNNIYVINPLLLSFYFYERFDIQLFLTEMIKHRRRIFCENNTGWIEYVNTYPAYFQATKQLLSSVPELSGSKIHNSYYGKNCEIDFSVKLLGQQFFGDDCRIGLNCVLENSIFLNKIQIADSARIKNSILQKNVKIGKNCELENCLIGENCIIEDNIRLPAGIILAADSVIKTDSGILNV